MRFRSLHFSRRFIGVGIGIVGVQLLVICFILFHLGGIVSTFTQLAGAIIGGTITLISVNIPIREGEAVEPWLGRERLAWILVGCGLLMWGFGESFWRYFILTNQSPFPSQADIGYASLPPLVLLGLLLQPSSQSGRGRLLMFLDSLIAMGALLSIAWFLLLGSLALGPSNGQSFLARFLGLYYPTTDIALLSCVVLLLLRGQGRLYQATARRMSLLVIGLGLCFFATSDFIFNIQQNASAYVEGTWVDIGWPLGMVTIGLAAYLRRFLPSTSGDLVEQRLRRRAERVSFGPEQAVPYILLVVLFIVLIVNVLSNDAGQAANRPVLLFASIAVVGLVVVRQILTLLDNTHLARRQADALERLEFANRQIEDQSRMISDRNAALEEGVAHLKEVQASLANGNLHARARLTRGELFPLASSLNLMAERLMRLEQVDQYARYLAYSLAELSVSIERYRLGGPFVIPLSCNNFPEINRLLLSMGLKEKLEAAHALQYSGPMEAFPSPSPVPVSAVQAAQQRRGNSRPNWSTEQPQRASPGSSNARGE